MKRLLMLTLGGLLAGTLAMAADEENSAGTDTKTTKTTTKKTKDEHGKHKSKVKESKTHKSDGGSAKKTTSEESNTPAD